jgi:hypothetical protein
MKKLLFFFIAFCFQDYVHSQEEVGKVSIFKSSFQPIKEKRGDFKMSFTDNMFSFYRNNIFQNKTTKDLLGTYYNNSLINIAAYWVSNKYLLPKLRWTFSGGYQQFEPLYYEPPGYYYFTSPINEPVMGRSRNQSPHAISFNNSMGYARAQNFNIGMGFTYEQKLLKRWFLNILLMPNISYQFKSHKLTSEEVNKKINQSKIITHERYGVDTLHEDFLSSSMLDISVTNRVAFKLKSLVGLNYYITKRLAFNVDLGVNVGVPFKGYFFDLEVYYPNRPNNEVYKRERVWVSNHSVDLALGLIYKF